MIRHTSLRSMAMVARRTENFSILGLGDPIAVSAVHGHGTGDLLDACFEHFPPEEEEGDEDDVVKVAVIGKPNVGKSSLVNRILGEERVIVSNSQTKTITVAVPMAISACSRMKERIWSSVPGSMPPVSTMSNMRLRHSHWAYSRSRVTPGVSSTMGERLLIPASMLRSGENVFLDDVTTADVERALGVPVVPVPQDGYELLDSSARPNSRLRRVSIPTPLSSWVKSSK